MGETIRQREEDIKTLKECKERVERHIEGTWTRNITDKITQASFWLAEKSQLSQRLTQTSDWLAENNKLAGIVPEIPGWLSTKITEVQNKVDILERGVSHGASISDLVNDVKHTFYNYIFTYFLF